MLGFRSKTLIVFRSLVRGCSNVAPTITADSNHGTEKLLKLSDLTVSYLVDTCRFTHETATLAAKKVQVKSSQKADKVLSLFKEYGFNDREISRLLEKRPALIACNPEKSLRPKLNILVSLGPSRDLLVKILVRCPEILQISFNKTLVPSLKTLRSILGSDTNVLAAISKSYRLLQFKLPSVLGTNVEILREAGMPDEMIAAFLKDRSPTLLSSPDRLRVLVKRTRDIGFDPIRYGFIVAMSAFSAMSDKTWEQKVELLKKWGWSDDEVVFAFKRCPQCMMTSEKKLDGIMDYVVTTLKLDPYFLAVNSTLFTHSLEKRITPRCSIIQYVVSKGMLEMKDFSLNQALIGSDNKFNTRFLLKYEKTLPELFDLYAQYKSGAVSGICQPLNGCSFEAFQQV